MPDAHPDPLYEIADAQTKALVELKRQLTIKGDPFTIALMKKELHRILQARAGAFALSMPSATSPASATLSPAVRAPRKPNRIDTMDDDQFVTHLETQPHLAGVDIRREIGKCQLHFEAQGIVPSRKRIVAWVNKADKPLGYNGAGKTSFAAKKPEPTNEPAGWREWVRENASDPSWAEKPWSSLDRTAQRYLIEQLKASA